MNSLNFEVSRCKVKVTARTNALMHSNGRVILTDGSVLITN